MKFKKWKWQHWLLLLGLLCLCTAVGLTVAGRILGISIITDTDYGATWQCPVATSETEYELVHNLDTESVTCNTAELQQATATFTDQTTLSFYLEFDGEFVSWDTPENFECQASWTDSISKSGTIPLESDTAQVICYADHTVLVMTSYTLVPSTP